MQIGFLLLAGVACVLSAPLHESDYVPPVPVVLEELTSAAKIQLAGLPEGVTKVWLQVKEINDLTGNTPEDGFEFPYRSEVDIVYYPELDSGKGNVFRMMVYGPGGWSQWSGESAAVSSVVSRYEVEEIERNWHDAKQFCIDHHKRLAMPKNQAENDKMLLQYQEAYKESEDDKTLTAWIGLSDENWNNDKTVSQWRWVDETKLGKFSNWEYGASMDSKIETAAVGLGMGGRWEADDPIEKHPFICEQLLEGEVQDVEAEAKAGIDASVVLIKRDA